MDPAGGETAGSTQAERIWRGIGPELKKTTTTGFSYHKKHKKHKKGKKNNDRLNAETQRTQRIQGQLQGRPLSGRRLEFPLQRVILVDATGCLRRARLQTAQAWHPVERYMSGTRPPAAQGACNGHNHSRAAVPETAKATTMAANTAAMAPGKKNNDRLNAETQRTPRIQGQLQGRPLSGGCLEFLLQRVILVDATGCLRRARLQTAQAWHPAWEDFRCCVRSEQHGCKQRRRGTPAAQGHAAHPPGNDRWVRAMPPTGSFGNVPAARAFACVPPTAQSAFR